MPGIREDARSNAKLSSFLRNKNTNTRTRCRVTNAKKRGSDSQDGSGTRRRFGRTMNSVEPISTGNPLTKLRHNTDVRVVNCDQSEVRHLLLRLRNHENRYVRIRNSLATGMRARHCNASALLCHVLAAFTLGPRHLANRQKARHRRCRKQQRGDCKRTEFGRQPHHKKSRCSYRLDATAPGKLQRRIVALRTCSRTHVFPPPSGLRCKCFNLSGFGNWTRSCCFMKVSTEGGADGTAACRRRSSKSTNLRRPRFREVLSHSATSILPPNRK